MPLCLIPRFRWANPTGMVSTFTRGTFLSAAAIPTRACIQSTLHVRNCRFGVRLRASMPYESIPAVSDGSLKKDHPDETRPDQRLHRPATNCSRVRGGGGAHCKSGNFDPQMIHRFTVLTIASDARGHPVQYWLVLMGGGGGDGPCLPKGVGKGR